MKPQVSSTVPDWSRERKHPGEWNPGKSLLASLRDYQRLHTSHHPLAPLFKRWAVLRHRFWSAVSGADIPLSCQIAGGLLLPHPNGVVIHPGACIGPNCLIFQQVTLGTRGSTEAPVLEGHVDIGAGAKLLGGIRIGEHAQIGANAVVLNDIPSGTSAVGAPAKVVPAHKKGEDKK